MGTLNSRTAIYYYYHHQSCTFVHLCKKVKSRTERASKIINPVSKLLPEAATIVQIMKKKCQEKKAECAYELHHEKGSKADAFPCCLTNAPGYSLRGTRTASTLSPYASAGKELKMRHKATERHTFSVRTVTDDKNHVL